ncbi:unnamed protein product, partial [Symbiodinium sp. CCMP2592]
AARFKKLRKAVNDGLAGPPADLRFLKKCKPTQEGVSEIFSFLQEIYNSVAENMPDVRDSTMDPDQDPYAAALTNPDRELDLQAEVAAAAAAGDARKTRQRFRSVTASEKTDDQEPRFLPPGSMKEYFEQFLLQSKQKVGFATFWRVWRRHFPRMTFRPTSSHAVCTTCVRHKSLIASLNHHLNARRHQQELYYAHIRQQFNDRCIYWSMRGLARLRTDTVTMICDGMDQSKFCLPRSPFMRAKAFDSWARPKQHVYCCLVHGQFIAMSVSEPCLRKDSNTCVELVGSCLQRLKDRGMQLSRTHVNIQADNTSREMKNGPVLRMLAALVSNGSCLSATASYLRTGHSHEDVDQLFGQVAKHLKRVRQCQTSEELVSHVQSFLDALPRPYEPGRFAFKVDNTREWKGFYLKAVPVQLTGIAGPGLDENSINDKFWGSKYPDHPHDVILRFPQGLPQGSSGTKFLAEKNPIDTTTREHIAKYAPMLRDRAFRLDKAADYLESWVAGVLVEKPLLNCDVTPAVHSVGISLAVRRITQNSSVSTINGPSDRSCCVQPRQRGLMEYPGQTLFTWQKSLRSVPKLRLQGVIGSPVKAAESRVGHVAKGELLQSLLARRPDNHSSTEDSTQTPVASDGFNANASRIGEGKAGPANAKAAKQGANPATLEKYSYVHKITAWLKDTVLPAGSIDAFLSNQMEKKLDFARWMDNFCPADSEKAYSIDSNGCYLRPFQLGWRSDFGISGMMEPETAELLLELILTEGFLTDPNVVGVEKLGVTLPPPEYLDGGITECPAINLGSALLPPFSVGYVKGWKRAVCLILALCGIRVLGLEAEVPHHIRVTMGTIHCSFGAFQGVKAKVLASRGGAEQQFSETQNEIDWHSQTAIAKAFQIGRSEAGAVQQLITAVPKDVKNALETAVKQRGMVKFLGHEAVARQLFSASYINTSPGMDAWRDQLTNAPGDSRIVTEREHLVCKIWG